MTDVYRVAVIGGDGMECIIDYSDASYRYGEIYYGTIYQTTGYGYGPITSGITESGPLIAKFNTKYFLAGLGYAGRINGHAGNDCINVSFIFICIHPAGVKILSQNNSFEVVF